MISGNRTGKQTTSSVYEFIKSKIFNKELKPGEKINQQRIAEESGISRTPVVKALHKLETQGLVDNIHEKGFYVHDLSIKELLDLFSLREALDTMIVNELIESISDTQLKRLEALFNGFCSREADEIDEIQYSKCDREFHNLLAEFCTNSLVKQIDENFQIFNRTLSVGLLRKPEETLGEHMQIIDYIRKGKRKEAIASVNKHNARTKQFLQTSVSNLKRLGIDPNTIPYREISTEGK